MIKKLSVLIFGIVLLAGIITSAGFGYDRSNDQLTVTTTTINTNFTNLSELLDVNIPSPNNAEALVYNSASSQWIASVISGTDNGTWNEDRATGLYSPILWSYNHTLNTFYYNQTQPFTNWLSTFLFNYNQTDGADNSTWEEERANTLYAPISSGGDNSSWNKTYADTLYSDILWGYNQTDGSDNSTWNEERANTLYALIGTGGNSSFNKTYTDTLYSDIQWSYNHTLNTFYYNQTQPFTNWLSTFLFNYNQTDGADNSTWEEERANTLYAPISSGGDNSSWNKTYADTLYSDILWGYNQTDGSDNSTWNEERANTLYALIGTGGNSSFNKTYTDTLYSDIQWSYNHTLNTFYYNQTQPFTNWLSTFLFNYNQTDGADNSTWEEERANTLYAPISSGGDNSSWNKTYADTLYSDILWGYNHTLNSFYYNQTQPFTNWLSTFLYDYNQTETYDSNITFGNKNISEIDVSFVNKQCYNSACTSYENETCRVYSNGATRCMA